MLANDPVTCLKQLREKMAELKKQETALVSEIIAANKSEIDSQLANADYGCGTVHIGNLAVTISKNVKWNQEGLKQAFLRLQELGENPLEYIKVS